MQVSFFSNLGDNHDKSKTGKLEIAEKESNIKKLNLRNFGKELINKFRGKINDRINITIARQYFFKANY